MIELVHLWCVVHSCFCAVLIIVLFHSLRRLPTITVNVVVKSSIDFNLTKFSELNCRYISYR